MPKKSQVTRTSRLKSKIRPVERTSISDEIVDQILALIASGDLKPGERLPSERELCKNFNAGRSSLREALRCLSIVGVLTARVVEGTSVAPNGGRFLVLFVEWRITTEKHDIEDMMQVRIALEGVTAASVAMRASEEDLANLQAMISKMEAALNNEKAFAALDLEFHILLATISQNFLIYDLVAMIRGQLEKMLQKVLLLPNAVPLTFKEHVTICNAIKRHDPVAASEAMRKHLESALKRYLDSLVEPKVAGTYGEAREASKTRKRGAKADA